MSHRAKPPVARHVDAVVITRAQVNRGELAVVETTRLRGVAGQQRAAAERFALGLKNLVMCDRAELADRAIGRADHLRRGERTRTGAQCPGKEVVEGRVGLGRLPLSLRHVDTVAGNEAPNHPGRHGTQAPIRQAAERTRHERFGQDML